MTDLGGVRGCVHAAAHHYLGNDPTTASRPGERWPDRQLLDAIEQTYQVHKGDPDLVHPKGGVDWQKLAELHRARTEREPTLF